MLLVDTIASAIAKDAPMIRAEAGAPPASGLSTDVIEAQREVTFGQAVLDARTPPASMTADAGADWQSQLPSTDINAPYEPVAATQTWEALLDCDDEMHGDSMARDIAIHRPAIEAAIRAAALDEARAAVDGTPTPTRHVNDANGNWFTTDMEYGWDCAAEAALAAIDALREKD